MPKSKKYVNMGEFMRAINIPCFFDTYPNMVTMYYWQKLSKRFAIKVALPHLLLGVLAATLSLSNQNALPVNQPQTNIVTIASVMVGLQEQQADIHTQSVVINPFIAAADTQLSKHYPQSIKVVRLTPDNGIRAGPLTLLA